MIRLFQALADRFTLYLPVILMGLLALGTYWLVRSTPLLMLSEQALPVSHDPDYHMRNFSVKTFDTGGQLKSEVRGNEARHYPDNDTLEIESVRIRAFTQNGHASTANASRALINGDASELQLFGDARVVREKMSDETGRMQPQMEFRGESLRVFMTPQRVKSDQPVQLIRGADRFVADAMDFDNLQRFIELRGHVKGTLLSVPAN